MQNEKIIKSTRRVDKLLKILQGFMTAGIIVCAIFVVLTLLLGEKILADASTVRFGSISVVLKEGMIPSFSKLSGSIIMMLLTAIIACGVMWYIIRLAREILAPMKEGMPFAHGIALKIRKMAWLSLIGGAVIEVVQVIGYMSLYSAYDLSRIFSQDVVLSYTLDFRIEGTFVFVAILLFVLSHIFAYGEALQKEIDETL